MDFNLGLVIVVALALALINARRAYRRQTLRRRRRPRRSLAGDGLATASARSDMRAYDDTTTLLDAVVRTASTTPPAPSPPAGKPETARNRS